MEQMTAKQKAGFWGLLDKNGECLEWPKSKQSQGYGQLRIGSRSTGNSRVVLAHRAAYFIAHGEIDNSLFVCHSCDNPACCNPDHLFLGTHQQNMDDMDQKGRRVIPDRKGEKNGRAVLDQEKVLAIRIAEGSYRALAEQYGVSKSQIARVKTSQQWSQSA